MRGNFQAEKVWSVGFMSQNMESLCVRLWEITESDVMFQNMINNGLGKNPGLFQKTKGKELGKELGNAQLYRNDS